MKLRDVTHAIIPTSHNAYRPWALRKEAFAFFLGVVLAAEGLFVASLYHVNPSQTFLAAVAAAPANVAPAPVQTAQQAMQSLALAASDPQTAAAWVLWSVVAVLSVLLALAVVVHMRIQPGHLVLSGAVVIALAVFFIWCNATLWGPASGDKGLAAPTPAQYHW